MESPIRVLDVGTGTGRWGGQVGSFLASDARAVLARTREVLQPGSPVGADEVPELVRCSAQELEEHRTIWTVAIAPGRRRGRCRSASSG